VLIVALFNATSAVGSLADGGEIEARVLALGARLVPPEPLSRDGKPLSVEIPAPKLLAPELNDRQRVKFLAGAYRAVLKRRYTITSRYMSSTTLALESHADFPKLVWLAGEMVTARVAPLAWVLFSFDAWTWTERGKGKRSSPPTKWVWSKKRWKDQQEWFADERYNTVQLRTAPDAAALWRDWRCMWFELLRRAPTSRDEIAQVVDRWFPGDAFERRLTRARTQTWDWQERVDREMADGGWPWL
jgi:hypothetical protein